MSTIQDIIYSKLDFILYKYNEREVKEIEILQEYLKHYTVPSKIIFVNTKIDSIDKILEKHNFSHVGFLFKNDNCCVFGVYPQGAA